MTLEMIYRPCQNRNQLYLATLISVPAPIFHEGVRWRARKLAGNGKKLDSTFGRKISSPISTLLLKSKIDDDNLSRYSTATFTNKLQLDGLLNSNSFFVSWCCEFRSHCESGSVRPSARPFAYLSVTPFHFKRNRCARYMCKIRSCSQTKRLPMFFLSRGRALCVRRSAARH